MIKGLTIVFISTVFLYFQTNNKNEIFWSATNKLTWNDYKKVKGKTPNGNAAITLSYIKYEINRRDNKCVLSIEAFFSKVSSWVGANDTNSRLLLHEQIHFDIVEIAARKFRKEISEKIKTGKCNIDLKNLKSKYTDIFNKLNNKYDKETNHSLNKEAQKKWEEELIPKMLEELKEYSSTSIEINKCDCIY